MLTSGVHQWASICRHLRRAGGQISDEFAAVEQDGLWQISEICDRVLLV